MAVSMRANLARILPKPSAEMDAASDSGITDQRKDTKGQRRKATGRNKHHQCDIFVDDRMW